MPVSIHELQQCKLSGCYVRGTERVIKDHYKEHHHYCKKCKQVFGRWEDLARHRIASDKHFACNFCGSDFKSVHGVKRHVEIEHPPNQDVKCLGCSQQFSRGSEMIAHLEQGECAVISAQEFAGHVQQKMIVNTMLSDHNFKGMFGTGYLGANIDNDVEGGVALEQGPEPLPPKRLEKHVLGGMEQAPKGHDTLDPTTLAGKMQCNNKFPALPGVDTGRAATFAEGLTRLSLGSSGGADLDLDQSSKTGGVALSSKTSMAGAFQSPWSEAQGASKALFCNAKSTTILSFKEAQKQHQLSQDMEYGPNIFTKRVWDPLSATFNVELFYDPIVELYICSFDPCGSKFIQPADLITHIQKAHRTLDVRCPRCNKAFTSVFSLIRHAETPGGHCLIRHTDKFREVLSIFSGGFLDVTEQLNPDAPVKTVYTTEVDGKGREEEKEHVIRHKIWKYQSEQPADWEDVEEQKRVNHHNNNHINVATNFVGGRPGLPTAFNTSSVLPSNQLVGSSHMGDGLRTAEEGHRAYSMRDPMAEKRRNAWSGRAKGTNPVNYLEQLESGSTRPDEFEDSDSEIDTGTERASLLD